MTETTGNICKEVYRIGDMELGQKMAYSDFINKVWYSEEEVKQSKLMS